MHKLVRLGSVSEVSESPFRGDGVQSLRTALLGPGAGARRPSIRQALQRANFSFHRTCSYASIIQNCDVGEGKTLLMFWGIQRTHSGLTMSVSSCSSLHNLPNGAIGATNSMRERELRHIAQQTDISCHLVGPIAPPASPPAPQPSPLGEVAPLSPAGSVLAGRGRSMSLLGSVCALLLNKPGVVSAPKAAPHPLSGSASPSDNICRICFGGESQERLVRPCGCRGTVAAVHRACLERWLLQASTSYCELCRHHYVVTRTHNYGDGRWSWLASFAAWAWSGRGRALACDAWRALALGACSVLGTARALHACDIVLQAGARKGGGAALAANLFSSLLIGVIGALNGLLTTWILLKIQEHQMSWQAWRDSTLHVRLRLDGDSATPSDVTVTVTDGSPPLTPVTVTAVTAPTAERATNIADPFMVALPYSLPDP